MILGCVLLKSLVGQMVLGNDEGLSGVNENFVVDSMTLEEKLAIILLPVNSGISHNDDLSFEGEAALDNFYTRKNGFLDATLGFKSQGVAVPFPDMKAIKQIDDTEIQQLLKQDLLYQVSRNDICYVLASNDYLLEVDSKKHRLEYSLKNDNDYALWIFTSHGFQGIPVFEMPSELFSKGKAIIDIGNSSSKDPGFRQWTGQKRAIEPTSFENLVNKGNIFLTSNYERDHARLVRAYRNKWLIEEDLDKGCREILSTLSKGTNFPHPVRLIPPEIAELARRIAFEKSTRLFQKDAESLLPPDLTGLDIFVHSNIGSEEEKAFLKMVQNHLPVNQVDSAQADFVFWLTDDYSLHNGVFEDRLSNIKSGFPRSRIVLFLTGARDYYPEYWMPDGIDAIFTGSSDWPVTWEYMAQAIFSGIDIHKIKENDNSTRRLLPLSTWNSRSRLKFGIPEEVGMYRDSLLKIDTIMAEAIQEKATPGGQVLVARDGIVVWHKAYGHHTYSKTRKTELSDVYDVASITKMSATLPSLMKLHEMGEWSLGDSLARYFPRTYATDKASITIKELLLHESGLPSFIPFYLNTVDRDNLEGNLFSRRYSWQYNIKLDNYVYLNRNVRYREDVYRNQLDSVYSVPVARDKYMNAGYLDSMMIQVVKAPRRTRHQYLYSDLGFYFLGELVPRLSGMGMEYFAAKHFYRPLGMRNTAFLPSFVFDKDRIVPTEDDKAFRKQLLHGWVHDPNAAMMGGVAGHAGLFSNAVDLAKMMQMYLNGGTYGNKRYLKEETISEFTRKQNGINRRGLGFDKPELDTLEVSPVSRYASPSSYGHSGFTGSLVWADPENGIVYVFLSNRVHPNQYNRKLIEENYRTKIQDVVYRSIIKAEY